MSLFVGFSRQVFKVTIICMFTELKETMFKVLKENMIAIIQWIENFNKANLLKKRTKWKSYSQYITKLFHKDKKV